MTDRPGPNRRLRIQLWVMVLAICIAAVASFASGFWVGVLLFLALAVYPTFKAISLR